MAILRHIYRWRWGLVLLLVLGAQLLWQPAPVRAATCIVTTNADSGAGSLREKIADTNCSTINFNGNYTIALSSELTISRNVTIDGAGHAITISGNNAVRVFDVNASGVVTLSHLSIVSGKVDSSGGGIHNAGALTVQDCVLSDNVSAENGGGIFNGIGGVLTVQNSVLSANRAGAGGGGIGNRGALTLQGSTLSGNSARYGGGIFNSDGGQMTIYNSTLSGNAATGTSSDNGGGAIDQWASSGDVSATIINSTIVNNTAFNADTSGIWLESGALTLHNSIVAHNNVDNNFQRDGGTFTSQGYNLANAWNGLTTHATDLTANPQLDPLADNGGSTLTRALLPDSPAIDAGDPTTCLLTDQRDLPRADLCCDIGAFELQYADSDTVILPVSSSALTTFGPLMAGVRRDAAFTDPGVMTMTRTAAGQLAHSIGALWAITPTVTGGFSLTLQLCYTEAELNGLDETALRFWRYHEGDWTMIDSSPTLTTVNGYHCATISGVTGLSNWTLATDDPTAVSLATFSAAWQGEAVLVTWETAQELENLGFNLYRSPSPTGPWTRLNPIMIPTQHPGAVFGGVYEWLDTTAPSGSASYYRLEDIDSDGVSTFHGPIRPADGEPAAVGLRGFRAAANPQALFMLMFVLAGVGGVTFQRWNRWRSLRS